MTGRTRWTLWWLFLAAWTVALLSPSLLLLRAAAIPLPGEIGLGKVAHVAAYAILAGAVADLPMKHGRRWRLYVLLAVHAVLTETLQTMAGRTGRWMDVGLDWFGMALGWAARKWLARVN